jgi:hypothetical protein
MTTGGAFLFLAGLALAYVIVATLVTVRRGGRGPADPPASHLRIDPAGFPVPSTSSVPSSLGLRTPRRAAAR